MGCPMCDWKTASLLILGLAIILVGPGHWAFVGVGLAIAAYVWALWPKKA